MRLRSTAHSANLLNDDRHEVCMLAAQSDMRQSEELRKKMYWIDIIPGEIIGGTLHHREFKRSDVSKANSGRQIVLPSAVNYVAIRIVSAFCACRPSLSNLSWPWACSWIWLSSWEQAFWPVSIWTPERAFGEQGIPRNPRRHLRSRWLFPRFL